MSTNAMTTFRLLILICLSSLFSMPARNASAEEIIDFEDIGASLGIEDFNNGSDGAGGFESGSASFNNSYTLFDSGFEFWEGWSFSNTTDTTTEGFLNQYSNIVGEGFDGSSTFAVAFQDSATIQSSTGTFQSLAITNTTFAALSIRNGDEFAKQFGGESGNDPDFFSIDILSLDAAGNELASQTFFLADFRFADNSQDFILEQWETVDVSALNATRIGFRFASSDVGDFGINTPTYFALDNVVVAVPEPSGCAVIMLISLGFLNIRRSRIAG